VQQLQVARIKQEGTVLLLVFVPPETTFFHDGQRARLRAILIQALQGHNLIGELVVIWEFDGEIQFMGNPHWDEFIQGSGYANLYGQRNTHIVVK